MEARGEEMEMILVGRSDSSMRKREMEKVEREKRGAVNQHNKIQQQTINK